MRLYYKFSDYLKEKYGTKIYKLPLNIPGTCPNRDGSISSNGCIFCGAEGAGFENLPSSLSIKQQFEKNMSYMEQKYKPKKYIAYFQNYTNTYMPFEQFKSYINQVKSPDIAAIYISTRPDCITDSQLDFLSEFSFKNKIDIVFELGLQTVNYHTLKKINRGHTLAEYIDAVLRIKQKQMEICTHYIIDMPWDNLDDTTEGAKILSCLNINQVKIHSLYILKNTKLGEMYEVGEIYPINFEEYIERTITFLEYLKPDIAIQRLIGRAPQERTLFCNWGMSWWKIKDLVENKMIEKGSFQGKRLGITWK